MLQKCRGYVHTQTALDFKLNYDALQEKMHFKKVSVHNKRAMTPTTR